MRAFTRYDALVLIVLLAAQSTSSVADAFIQHQQRKSINEGSVTFHQRRNPRGWTKFMSQPIPVMLSSSSASNEQTTMAPPLKRRTKKGRKTSTTKDFSKKGGRKNGAKRRTSEFVAFNQRLVQLETAGEVLSLLASRKGALSSEGGGGALSTVNFSTAIHRIAKHLNSHNNNDISAGTDRAKILSDPRFALLMCSTAEAVLDGAEAVASNDPTKRPFGAREYSNLAWGISKLRIAPPKTIVPVDLENAEELLRKKSHQVRSTILEVAKERTSQSASSSKSSTNSLSWIPALSELCGLLVDTVCAKAMRLDSSAFEQQELSSLLYGLTLVERPSEEVFEYVVQSIIQSSNRRSGGEKKPQEWSIPLWCLAKAGFSSGHEEELLPFVLDLMDNEPGFLERFKPQELSNTVWGAATIISKREKTASGPACDAALGMLRHAARELIRRDGENYSSQELTNTCYAMALLGFGVVTGPSERNANMLNAYIYISSDDPEGDRVLMQQSLAIAFRQMKKRIRQFANQELNNMCYVMARLGVKDEELFGMIGRELTNPKRAISPTDISISLWSMATMEYSNDDLYRALGARLPAVGPERAKPQEMSTLIWSFATAGVLPENPYYFDTTLPPDSLRPSEKDASRDPITTCARLAAEDWERRPFEWKPNEVKNLLWSFVKLGIRNPSLFRSAAEHLVGSEDDANDIGRGFDQFDSQGIANLAYAYARHSQLGASIVQRYQEKCSIPPTGGRLACYTVAFLDVGEGLLRKLYSRIAKAQLQCLEKGQVSSQDIANTVWGFAIHGLKHKPYLDAIVNSVLLRWKTQSVGRESSLERGQEIANFVWAIATLNYTPKGLLDVLEVYLVDIFQNDFDVSKISRIFTRQELANLAFSLAVFGEYPQRLIQLLHMGLLGTGDRSDPSYLQKMYGDDGIDQVHINSLMYLQIMLDLELGVGRHPFSLPQNFPAAWTDNPAFSSSSSDDGSFLEINTSNTQIAVSKAFDRVGFPHVDEHIYTMEDLVNEYGINMGSYPVDILSMDIANVESRIGIELDGPGHWVSNISNDGAILDNVGFYRRQKSTYEYVFKWSSEEQEMNGSTALKLRMYQKMGWKIVNIPFWDWTPIHTNEKLEEEYVQTILDEIL